MSAIGTEGDFVSGDLADGDDENCRASKVEGDDGLAERQIRARHGTVLGREMNRSRDVADMLAVLRG